MSMHQGACGGGGFRWSRIGHERDRTGEISAALAGPAIRHNPWEYWTLGHGTVLDGTRISVFKTVAIVRSAIPPPTKLHAGNVFEVWRPLMERARGHDCSALMAIPTAVRVGRYRHVRPGWD